ncbi:type II secretion system protein [Anaeromyxobacter dehalogenans 2CP-1]|uniref:Type II secretion system protein n=1 Tax=Anaeromyxobacter dehalogenans (strain ATCC BAA-258 / DSM 21875 / 2CP-1) TaxID=455488 RepID=B8JCY7_ANAD2|nr:type II secretion system F family protein [Anaeromyxobacter dehalogenans]ACL64015.1 type II secretion system protein [Anaeromyxobacter dehalogenans 2CP-1]
MAQAAAANVKTRAATPAKVWKWSGKTRQGEVRSGEMEAQDAAAVQARLRQMGIEPEKVRRKPKEIQLKIPGMGGVTTKDLLVFTRQFSVMIDAGLPLVQALDIIATQADNPEFRRVLSTVKVKVESGSTFADALGEHPKVFDELFVQLVRAGEIGGILDTILQRLGAYIEKNEKLSRRVKGAMVYPAIVLTVAVGVVAVLIAFVVPTFEKMFKDFGGAMPAPTQFLIDISHGFRNYWFVYVGVPVALFVAFKTATRKGRGQEIWHDTVLKLPVFGPLVRKVAVARFTRTLGTMLSSGVPILDALEIVAKSAGNRTIERGILYVRAKISEGKNIAGPLAETKVFPAMVVQMIGVGEATGAMDAMLNKIADFYDDEVDVAVGALTSMIEPLMMVFLGGTVGFFMIAMYMPIFNIAGTIK